MNNGDDPTAMDNMNTKPFAESIAEAAAQAPQNTPDAIPSELPLETREKLAAEILRQCAEDGDKERERRFRERYPEETADLIVRVDPVRAWAGKRKDRAWYAAMENLIRRWLTASIEEKTTAKEDIAWLNQQGSTRTFPDKFLSRDQSKEVLTNLSAAALGGMKLPKDCTALAHIKKMIRAAKLNEAAGEAPFGSIAKRVGRVLVGKDGHEITIGSNGGRDAIRVMVHGKLTWLRLDAFEAGLEAIGYGAAYDHLAASPPATGSSLDTMITNVVSNLSRECGLTEDSPPAPDEFPRENGLMVGDAHTGDPLAAVTPDDWDILRTGD